jgi:pyruvate/2-oxoglutarate dehydrogenase complex dihydrolipoamide acyltransferase (E2) component
MRALAGDEPVERSSMLANRPARGSPMRLEAVILPELGTGPAEPIVVSHWYAARGDRVWEGDRLVEVLVGPATFDVSSPSTGRLAAIHGREDDRVLPGAVLGLVAVVEDDGADPPSGCPPS